jgi:molecular chaperone GrpE
MMKKKNKEEEETKENNRDNNTGNSQSADNNNVIDPGFSDIPVSDELPVTLPGENTTEGNGSDKTNPEITALQEKLAEMQDRYIRLSAEFDNYRKRTLREKMELSKYAGENLFLKIIPLMDDFERALKLMDATSGFESFKEGIDLIYLKFSEFLKQNGIREIEALNCNFNVDLYEAVAKVPVAESDKKGKVVEVILKGYYLQDKVLRFSKVVVAE